MKIYDNKQMRSVDKVPLNAILPPKIAMRNESRDESLESLAKSISEYGLLQPILLKKVGKKYEVIAGHRRLNAHKLLKLPAIDALITKADARDVLVMRLFENKHRENVTPFEEATYLNAMLVQLECKQTELAALIGVSNAYLSERLKILKYPPPLLASLRSGEISFSVAYFLMKLSYLKILPQYLEWTIKFKTKPNVLRYIYQDVQKNQTILEQYNFMNLSKGLPDDGLSLLDNDINETHTFCKVLVVSVIYKQYKQPIQRYIIKSSKQQISIMDLLFNN